ncbi:MAG: hypothetical protein Q9223_006450 [Gallowayella weberi]
MDKVKDMLGLDKEKKEAGFEATSRSTDSFPIVVQAIKLSKRATKAQCCSISTWNQSSTYPRAKPTSGPWKKPRSGPETRPVVIRRAATYSWVAYRAEFFDAKDVDHAIAHLSGFKNVDRALRTISTSLIIVRDPL